VLDQLFLKGVSEESIAFAKMAGHWLSFGPPLMLAAIPAAALMKLPREVLTGSSSACYRHAGLAALDPRRRRADRRPAPRRRARRPADAAARRAAADLRRRLVERGNEGGALQLLGAVSLLLVAGAPFARGCDPGGRD
jgi:heme exporter protein B